MTWPTTPTRFVLTEVDERGLHNGQDAELLSVSEYRGVIPRRDSVSQQAASEDVSHYKRCNPGQLVLNRLWAFRGGLGVSSHTGLVSPDYAVYDIDPRMDPRFVHYQTRSSWFVAEMTKRLRGIGNPDASNGRAPRINTSDLGRIHMYSPPLEVQRWVADRLDDETSRIDPLIAKNEQVLETLGIRLRTRVDGLMNGGQSHRVPLRFLVTESTDNDVAPLRRVLTLDRVEGWTGRVLEFDGTDEEGAALHEGKTFRPGDVLFSKLRPYLAKVVLPTDRGVANPEFLVFQPHDEVVPQYLHYVMLSPTFVSWASAMSYGAKMPRTNAEALGKFSVPLPDRPTQESRSAQIAELYAKFRELTRKIREQIGLLETRRQSLVNAAVTGQIDVGQPGAQDARPPR